MKRVLVLLILFTTFAFGLGGCKDECHCRTCEPRSSPICSEDGRHHDVCAFADSQSDGQGCWCRHTFACVEGEACNASPLSTECLCTNSCDQEGQLRCSVETLEICEESPQTAFHHCWMPETRCAYDCQLCSDEGEAAQCVDTQGDCPEFVYHQAVTLSTPDDIEVLRYCSGIEGPLYVKPRAGAEPHITDLSGLGPIAFVDSLHVEDNTQLVSIEGLSDLTRTDRIVVTDNLVLTDLSGLHGVEELRGRLSIKDNPALVGLDGLDGLRSVQEVFIEGNPLLESLQPLGRLTQVDGWLSISGSAHLTDLRGLEGVAAVPGVLRVFGNSALQALHGLEGLRRVGDQVVIDSNAELRNLDGLAGVVEIGDRIFFLNNPMLPTCRAEAFVKRMRNLGWSSVALIEGNDDTGICP
ncbi:MAG: hypothetical protein ABIF77_11145 [bacterium]